MKFLSNFGGKERLDALGKYPQIGLKEARARREEIKLMLDRGLDPSAERQKEKVRTAIDGTTFEMLAREWHGKKLPKVKDLTAQRIMRRLEMNVFPTSANALSVPSLHLNFWEYFNTWKLQHAEWSEIDFDKAEWIIPAGKMKMGTKHIVPLSRQALQILRDLHPVTGVGRYVFPHISKKDRPMSPNTILSALRGIRFAQRRREERCALHFPRRCM